MVPHFGIAYDFLPLFCGFCIAMHEQRPLYLALAYQYVVFEFLCCCFLFTLHIFACSILDVMFIKSIILAPNWNSLVTVLLKQLIGYLLWVFLRTTQILNVSDHAVRCWLVPIYIRTDINSSDLRLTHLFYNSHI